MISNVELHLNTDDFDEFDQQFQIQKFIRLQSIALIPHPLLPMLGEREPEYLLLPLPSVGEGWGEG
jgi:hypothetical protein